jgi:hypothetical protein
MPPWYYYTLSVAKVKQNDFLLMYYWFLSTQPIGLQRSGGNGGMAWRNKSYPACDG